MDALVIGGTGMLGEPVVRQLAASGHHVRVLTRTPERAGRLASVCELVKGDLDDRASVERALTGCEWVHLNLNGNGDWDLERRGAQLVASLAPRAGVQRLSLISGASVDERNAWFPMTRAKLDAEQFVQSSGVPFQIFRCTLFMELLPKLVRDGKAMIMGPQPKPTWWIAAADYAAMVSRAFTLPAAAGKIFHVRGPQALTMEEALRIYCEHRAPGTKVMHLPFGLVQCLALFPGNRDLRRVALPLMRYFSKAEEYGDPTETNALLGAPRTILAAWAMVNEPRVTPDSRRTPEHV